MKTALIIHGHFYQPPRENPATGIVENQDSASPYKNWNEAIYQTCYKPNASSRYLNPKGKILWISNNYEKISTNYGPTLLKWLDAEHPNFIKKLVEADKKSIKKTGHSNFIAQCYNHTILPLDSAANKRVEIAWALEDYKKRFGHDSEGFWCSECAIDEETIDELANAGVKFVVLSPWQATAINGKKLNGQCAPCDRPFIVKGKKKSISAFFYDPDLASGISFGHYLTDADRLYNHLVDMKRDRNNPSLISCATDGEIYGHHEAFGDMALAALIKKVEDGNDFYFTNYASYLEQNPATEVATLFNGKSHSGSSWSCYHGVERWCSDCGCHTGGPDNWNQKWRAPLRKAFNNLEEKAYQVINQKLSSIFGSSFDFEKTIIDYGKVIVNATTVSAFIKHLEESFKVVLSAQEKTVVASLLDSYKNILFSFTSCGWFFNDISGIEPKQNITYAINAANLLNPYSKTDIKKQLLHDLSKAKSNIEEEGNGKDIALRCDSNTKGQIIAAFFFIQNNSEKNYEKIKKNYGYFKQIALNDSFIKVQNTVNQEVFEFKYSIINVESNIIKIEIVDCITNEKHSASYSTNNDSLNLSKADILNNMSMSFAKEIEKNGLNEIISNLMVVSLDGLRAQGVEPNLSELQNVIYPYLVGKKKASISTESRKLLIEKFNFAYELL